MIRVDLGKSPMPIGNDNRGWAGSVYREASDRGLVKVDFEEGPDGHLLAFAYRQ